MEDTMQTGLKELQNVELGIAKEFAEICDRHSLVYYMIGGTLLGAIRHKGFIPWDDDMDFAMMRDDYEKFLKIAPKELPEHLKVVNYRNSAGCLYYFARMVDTDTKVVEERVEGNNRNTNASVDIFPIDGSPNNVIFRKLYFFRVLYHRAIMSMCHKESIDKKRKRGIPERSLIFVMSKLPLTKFTSGYKQMDKIDKIMRKQKVKESKYIGNLMGAYRTKEVVPAEFYGQGQMYPFEDTEFRGLSLYDKYLESQYGDYMKLPPKEDRERKSHYKIIELHGEKFEE